MRGKNGGIRLACAPKDINLGVLIKQVEPDFALAKCFATDLSITPKPDSNKSVANIGSNHEENIAKDMSLKLIDETASHIALGCIISPVCQLKQMLSEALTAFMAVLKRYNLADIISNEAELLFDKNSVNRLIK